MVKRIEIIGIPGSGKTTIYKCLERVLSHEKHIFTNDRARKICTLELIKDRENNKVLRFLYAFFLNINTIDRLFSLSRRLIYQHYEITPGIELSSQYIPILTKITCDMFNKIPLTRFLDIACKFRNRLIDMYLFDKYLPRNCVVIQDEYFMQSSSFDTDDTIFYIRNMISIKGIVILLPDAKLITDRLKSRRKIFYTDIGKTNYYQSIAHRVMPLFEEKLKIIKNENINIVELNIADTPHENAKKILSFAQMILK